MNKENNKIVVKGDIGFTGVLTIVFIVLKLCKVINWSWIWVLSPIWISVVFAIFISVIFIIFMIIIAILNM